MSSRVQQPENGSAANAIKPIVVSVFIGIIFCALILLLMSIVITTQNIPQAAIEPMAIFSLSAGSFAAGYLCAKAIGSNGLVYGALCGFIISALVLIAGAVSGGTGLGMPALFKIVFIMISSMIGGIVRVNSKRRRR